MDKVALVDRTAALGRSRTVSTKDIRRRMLEGPGTTATPGRYRWVSTNRGWDWLARARRALAEGDCHVAGYAAGVALYRYGDTAQAWSLLARADAGLERFADAVVEAQRAVALEPHNAEHHATLAGILEELGNWPAALQCYRMAQRLDPASEAYRVGAASVLVQCGQTRGALRILEDTYALCADKYLVGDCLSLALTGAAEQVPRVHGADEVYYVTAPQEITQMRVLLRRAALVTGNAQLHADIAWVRSYVDGCAQREYVSGRLLRTLRGRLYLAVAVLACLATAVLAGWSAPESLAPVAAVACCAGVSTYCLARYARVPRWRLNQWALARDLGEVPSGYPCRTAATAGESRQPSQEPVPG